MPSRIDSRSPEIASNMSTFFLVNRFPMLRSNRDVGRFAAEVCVTRMGKRQNKVEGYGQVTISALSGGAVVGGLIGSGVVKHLVHFLRHGLHLVYEHFHCLFALRQGEEK